MSSRKKKNGERRRGKLNTEDSKLNMSKVKLGKSNKTTVEKILNNHNILCDYGCNQLANYKFGNGKNCCSNFYTGCSFVKQKSLSTLKNSLENEEFRLMLSTSKKGKKFSKGTKIENNYNILCSYGCNKLANYYFKTVNRYCCSETYMECDTARSILSEGMTNSWKNENSGHHSEERSEKRTIYMKEKWSDKDSIYNSKEYRELLSEKVLEAKRNNPEICKLAGEKLKERFKDPVFCREWGIKHSVSPNKPETIILDLLNEIFPNEFVFGGSTIWINGKNPDFVNEDQKMIIEHFGSYYHGEEHRIRKYKDYKNNKEHELEKINFFRDSGYDCLIIWENELKNIKNLSEKIIDFYVTYKKEKENI